MKYIYNVVTEVEIEIDESKFIPHFLQEFIEVINDEIETPEDHRQYLAELYASGRAENGGFIEGYGHLNDFGVKGRIRNVDVDPCQ